MSYKVLVVEDDPVVAVGVASMVEDCGHELAGVAASGEDALVMAEETRPDVALVDVQLPGIDGIKTTSELVTRWNIGTVILTAFDDPQFIQGATDAGAFAYLLKPVTKEAMNANLHIAARRAREFTELRKEATDVRAALEARKLTERAKGVLMDRFSYSDADAFAHLRTKCRNQNKSMQEVAREIIEADESFLKAVDNRP